MTNFPPPLNDGQQPPYGEQRPPAQQNFQGFSSPYQNQQNQHGQMAPYVFQGKPPMGAGKIVLIVLGSIVGLIAIFVAVGFAIAAGTSGSTSARTIEDVERIAEERLAADPGFGHSGKVPDPTYISPKGEFGAYFLRKPTIERYDMNSQNWTFEDLTSDTYFTSSATGNYNLTRYDLVGSDEIDPDAPDAQERAVDFIERQMESGVSSSLATNSDIARVRVNGAIYARSYITGPIWDHEYGGNIYYQMMTVITKNAYYELSYPTVDRLPSIKIDFFRAFKLYGDHKNPKPAPEIVDQLEVGRD